ncbi:MAG: catalase family protein, partial [Novosphingobium sp.]|nr:catalase family protein [Novosphingobium sp.]
AMRNPKGRANYEPNSWGPQMGGPREDPVRGFRSFAETNDEPKQRMRPESFADHYSQARQFFISQTPIEQKHIGDALVFELSKVERPDIRLRIVSHLRNIDAVLAQTVADGLGAELPEPAQAAMPTRQDLAPSPALSIVANGPQGFAGRKLGIVVSDGTDADVFDALVEAVTAAGGVYDVVAPKIGGVTLSNGEALAARQKIDGGPSVLFDAVAVIPSADGARLLVNDAPSRDFVSDAFAHCKFIGLSDGGTALMKAAGLGGKLDDGCIALSAAGDAAGFIAACAPLRLWTRELKVDLDAKAS